MKVMPWLPNSADLNTTENSIEIVKKKKKKKKKKKDLMAEILPTQNSQRLLFHKSLVWSQKNDIFIENVIKSMPKRANALLKAERGPVN